MRTTVGWIPNYPRHQKNQCLTGTFSLSDMPSRITRVASTSSFLTESKLPAASPKMAAKKPTLLFYIHVRPLQNFFAVEKIIVLKHVSICGCLGPPVLVMGHRLAEPGEARRRRASTKWASLLSCCNKWPTNGRPVTRLSYCFQKCPLLKMRGYFI